MAIEVAERFADGLVDEEERSAVAYLVDKDKDDGLDERDSPRFLAEVAASWAIQSDEAWKDALDPDTENFAAIAARCAAQAARSCEREAAAQCRLLRDIFGNPFRPVALDAALRTPAVLALAQAAYDHRTLPAGTLDPERLAVLADALEEAGCTDAEILAHLRGPGDHVRGCWAVDTLLDKS